MGETFEGMFKDDEAYTGEGTFKYPWGDIFKGRIVNGIKRDE